MKNELIKYPLQPVHINKLNIGNYCYLNSGSPKMKIISILGKECLCKWGNNVTSYNIAMLTHESDYVLKRHLMTNVIICYN